MLSKLEVVCSKTDRDFSKHLGIKVIFSHKANGSFRYMYINSMLNIRKNSVVVYIAAFLI